MRSMQSILVVDRLTKPPRKSEEDRECLVDRCSVTQKGLRSCTLFQTGGTSAAANWAAGGGKWSVRSEFLHQVSAVTIYSQESQNYFRLHHLYEMSEFLLVVKLIRDRRKGG